MLIEITPQGEIIQQTITAQLTIANIYKELMQRVALSVLHALTHSFLHQSYQRGTMVITT